jgi:hypothetical protein
MVAREGDSASGMSGQVFTALSRVMMNVRGQMIFEAGVGLDSGFWAFDPEAGLGLIDLRSTPLSIGNGQTLTPLQLFFSGMNDFTSSGGDGLPGAFNDAGQFVFEADQGGTGGNTVNTGVFSVSVPEPPALASALLLAVAGFRRCKR